MSEKAKFLANFEQKQQAGLLDIKFCVENGSSLKSEDFFAASNRLDQAVAEGRCVRLDTWNRDPNLEPHEALV